MEASMSLLILLGPSRIAGELVVVFLVVVTPYGWLAVERTGTCGCSGLFKVTTKRSLVARNAAISVGAIILVMGNRGPSTRDEASLWLPILTLAFLALAGCVALFRSQGAMKA